MNFIGEFMLDILTEKSQKGWTISHFSVKFVFILIQFRGKKITP